MTKTVADNAAMLQVMAGSDWRDPQRVRGHIAVGDYAALSVPAGSGAHDLPIGLQIIGPRFSEELVYQAGFAFEAS